MQEFGSIWTEKKLDVIEKYLDFYTTALKKSAFKLCYIDAFAGSGTIKIKSGDEILGSALRALNYPFDKFYFFEEDPTVIETLKWKIGKIPEHKDKDIEYFNADCNNFLMEIDRINWFKDNWRGVIFLDPFAMDLEWTCLNQVSATKVFDVWYLVPFMAINRNLPKNGKILPANRDRLNRILGTSEWEKMIYSISPQLSFFDENTYLKENINTIKAFIINRLHKTFPTVSERAIFLLNEKHSPQFLLCFAGSNPSERASKLSLKVADSILSKSSM
jgi:three-Cys-motif partner protein